MKRRLALSLLTLVALLWQGFSVAAMGSMSASVSASASSSSSPSGGLSEHCRMMAAKAQAAHAAQPAAAAAKTVMAKGDCCKLGGHCVCAAACGAMSAGLPSRPGLIPLPVAMSLRSPAPLARVTATPPPHPFRPPITAAF